MRGPHGRGLAFVVECLREAFLRDAAMRTLVGNALRVAAARWLDDAETCRSIPDLHAKFTAQASGAAELADLLDE